MKNNKFQFILFALVASIIISSCNFPFLNNNQNDQDEILSIATQVAQTVTALESQMQQTLSVAEAMPTATLSPTATALSEQPGGRGGMQGGGGAPGLGENQTVPSSSTTSNQTQCFLASAISETYSDYTSVAPGDTFTKTWTLMNSGSCEWTSGYSLVFVDGEQMGGASPTYLGTTVSPGNTIALSVSLTAPTTAGTYQGNWALQSDSGVVIAYIWVLISVDDVSFAVTSAYLSADQSNYTGTCPYTYDFTGTITASTLGTVTYYYEFEDETTTSSSSLEFASSGTQSVSASRELTESGTYSTSLYIDEPNNQYFDSLDFTLTCE